MIKQLGICGFRLQDYLVLGHAADQTEVLIAKAEQGNKHIITVLL